MSWWDEVRWAVGLGDAASGAPVQNAAYPTTIGSAEIRRGEYWGELFGLSGPANLPVVTRQSAMTVAAVWACVSLIAGAVQMLPLHIYRNIGDGEQDRDWGHPLWWMFNEEFCPRWSASAGWEYLMLSRLFEGDAFAHILRDARGNVTGLVPLHPSRVQVGVWDDGSRLVYVVSPEPGLPDVQVKVIDQDDMLHVTGVGFDGRRSMSPLRHALRMTGAVTLAAQDFSAQFFANQQRPDYALVAPADVAWDEQQVEKLRAQIAERHGMAGGNAGKPMLLSGGVKVEAISLSNEDAELLATRKFQIEDIARAFGVPPFMIGHNEKTTSWGSGVAEMGTGFVRYVLRPHLSAFQNEINRKIFRGPALAVEFDTFELERADLKSLFEAFRAAVGRAGEPGIMTTNEVRSLIRLRSKPGGENLHPGVTPAGGQNVSQ